MKRLLVIALLLVGCATPAATIGTMDARERAVTSADFDVWPLTVDDGVLRCDPGRAVVFEVGDKVYALNGIATADPKYEALDPIWAADPTGNAPKMDIGPLVDAGLALCS